MAKCLNNGINQYEGDLFYSTAKDVVLPLLKDDFDRVSSYCSTTQSILNSNAHLDIKVIEPIFNNDKAQGIITAISEKPIKEVTNIINDVIPNFSQSIVTDYIKANAEMQYRIGLKPKIARKTLGKCCDWCENLAGVYTYPDVPNDIYRRHSNCRCRVVYVTVDGKRQNVWSKEYDKGLDPIFDEYINSSMNRKEIISGSRITDPGSKKAQTFANNYYGLVRKRHDDVAKISKNSGIEFDKIQEIKDYVFVNKSLYDTDLGVWKTFDEDCAMAHSWQRLIDGRNIQPHDYTLLNHEMLEMNIKKQNPLISHDEAHTLASKKYNYDKEAFEYYDNLRKLDSKK